MRAFPRSLAVLAVAVLAVAVLAVAVLPVAASAQSGGRALELKDLLGWKSTRSPVLSNDGRYLAFIVAPNEGDAEVVVRSTAAGGKEWRFPAGEPPAPVGGGGPPGGGGATPVNAALSISGNSRWVAYLVYPKAADAKRQRRDRRPIVPTLEVRPLGDDSNKKTEFDRVRSYRFAGERSDWIAVHHASPDAAQGGAGAAAAPAPQGGTTLEVVNLAEGAPTAIGSVGEFAFDASGSWLAWTVDAPGQLGNGVQARELATGILRGLDGRKAIFRRLTWADTGDAVALLRGIADTAAGDTTWTALGWSGVAGKGQRAVTIDSGTAGLAKGIVLSGERAPKWNDAQGVLMVGLRAARAAKSREPLGPISGPSAPAPGAGNAGITTAAANDEDTPSLVLWHWKDPRLQSQQQVQEGADKSFSVLAAYHVADRTLVPLSDTTMRTVTVAPAERWAVGFDDTKYATRASMDGYAFRDLYAIDVKSGARTLIARKVRNHSGGGANTTFHGTARATPGTTTAGGTRTSSRRAAHAT